LVIHASKEIKQGAEPRLNSRTAEEHHRQQEGTAMILRSLVACLSLSAGLVPSAVYAADAATCAKPHFSDVGWTDITATTQIANQILTTLGYKPNITVLSVAVTFQSLENGDIDVFLGNWMPLQEPSQAPLVKAGKIEAVTVSRLPRPPMTPG
jgi:glycine betaine/proline transport system substrate-binding protein